MNEIVALQPWLNFGGLTLDFIGVVLLAFEWRSAMRAERREVELAELAARREAPPNFPKPGGEHHETFAWMRRRRDADMRARRAHSAFDERSGWFTLAFVIIVIGFLLQIVGSLPL